MRSKRLRSLHRTVAHARITPCIEGGTPDIIDVGRTRHRFNSEVPDGLKAVEDIAECDQITVIGAAEPPAAGFLFHDFAESDDCFRNSAVAELKPVDFRHVFRRVKQSKDAARILFPRRRHRDGVKGQPRTSPCGSKRGVRLIFFAQIRTERCKIRFGKPASRRSVVSVFIAPEPFGIPAFGDSHAENTVRIGGLPDMPDQSAKPRRRILKIVEQRIQLQFRIRSALVVADSQMIGPDSFHCNNSPRLQYLNYLATMFTTRFGTQITFTTFLPSSCF